MRISDWSSDVCSSDLGIGAVADRRTQVAAGRAVAADRRSADPGRVAAEAGRRRLLAGRARLAAQRGRVGARRVRTFAESARTDFARSEEHTSELQSLMRNSYAVFCLQKKRTQQTQSTSKV